MLTIDLTGKAALVTGGARGIGEAISMTLAQCGANVCILDRKPELMEELQSKIERETGHRCITVFGDISDPAVAREAVNAAVEAFGKLDLAVNNAGIAGHFAPIHETVPEHFHRVIAVDLEGMFFCMKQEIAAMLRNPGGAIVNIASVEGHGLLSENPAYTAAKHAVFGLTKTAAHDYAAQGIRVNSVSPGLIRTPLSMAGGGITGPLSQQVPVGRMGEPEEIAASVAFLLSDLSSYTTGADLVVDGAFLLRG